MPSGAAAASTPVCSLTRRHPVGLRVDGFFHAHWRRPAAYLEERVRRGSSVWARVGQPAQARAVLELRADLESGRWQRQNAELLELPETDLGARLLIAG